MKATWARALVLSLLVTGTTAFTISAASENASAASVDGSWTSRISGEGYTQTYLGPYGGTITDSFDADLDVSSSGTDVSGTLTVGSQSYAVWGAFDGSTFMMTLQWGWDGVSYCQATYALTVDGDLMYGSGSYLNVGVTINGYFDLQRGGLFAVGGINPIVSAIGITLAIVAIVVAVSPPKVPKGFQTGTTSAPYAQQPVPSQQWTTGPYPQPPGPGVGTPVGGVGLHYPNERPLSAAEREALKGITRSPKVNAVGLAVMSMAMAVMINFVEEPVALIMPLFFGAMSLGVAFQARSLSSSLARALDRGAAVEWRHVPSLRSGAWDFGAFHFNRAGEAKGLVAEGVPATVTLVPEAKRVLAVNGTPLRKPMELRGAPGFPQNLMTAQAPSVPQAPAWQAPAAPAQAEDLPPPPEGWQSANCPKCGSAVSGDYLFCRGCGFRLKP
ncbi:MAG: zinc ribbon domain-containing protein [Candidatus Thermoplasmatota archaeon]